MNALQALEIARCHILLTIDGMSLSLIMKETASAQFILRH